jgi:release factor glutamine methyltransferase
MATRNALLNQVAVTFRPFDMLNQTLPAGFQRQVDLLVSNPPYVRLSERSDMQQQVLDYEPSLAIFVEDADPLIYYRAICMLARQLLKPGAPLYVEINSHLAQETVQLVEAFSFRSVTLLKDLFGRDRFIRALCPPYRQHV